MKILYNIQATYRSGGMERVLANKVNWFVANGHEVTVVTCDQQGRESFYAMDSRVRFIDLGIDYESNNNGSLADKLIHYPGKQRHHRKRLQKVLDEFRPDVTVSMFGNDAALVPSLKNTGKIVLEVHFSRNKRLLYGRKGVWGLIDRFRNYKDGQLVRKYDRFVALTEEDKPYWGNGSNVVVIPNASPYRVDSPDSLDTKVVFTAGRLGFQKGYERLIDAWKIAAENHPDWTLVIAGDGEDRGKLEDMIDSYGLKSSVKLIGATKEIEKQYRNASIAALSSRYEGLPMILIEAQSFGLPIVSFDCKCGPKDVISDGVDGYLVREGDVRAFAAALDKLMSDDDLRHSMGAKAFESSLRYTEETVMQKWNKLLTNLVAE